MSPEDEFFETEQTDLAPFFLVTNWDETVGPKIVEQFPSQNSIKTFLPGYNPLSFSTQIFMVASSLFGTQEYQQETVDLPIVSFETRIRVRVIFDFEIVPESEVRGGRLPYMLIVGYPQTKLNKKSLDSIQTDLADYLSNLIANKNKNHISDLKKFRNKLLDAKFTFYDTIDEFYTNLKYFSRFVVFGLITGTIVRQNIPEQYSFDKYLNEFPLDLYDTQKLSQIFIEEPYHEYWYCFWSGPFIIFLQAPLNHLDELQRFIKNIGQHNEHLWSLTLIDPHAELFNLFSNIEVSPKITGELFKISHMAITRKLSGVTTELGFENQFIENPEILFYLRDQARECFEIYYLENDNNGSLMINYLIDLKNIYSEENWLGIFSAISFFFGEFFNKKHIYESMSWYRTLQMFYDRFSGTKVKQVGRKLNIINCPFIDLDLTLGFFSFVRSFLLAQYPKYIFKISLLDNTSYSIEHN